MRLFFYDMPLHFYNNISDLNVQICEDSLTLLKRCRVRSLHLIFIFTHPVADTTSVNKNCGWDGLRSIFRRILAMFYAQDTIVAIRERSPYIFHDRSIGHNLSGVL